MLFPLLGLRGVVISDDDRVLMDSDVSFQAAEKIPGKVRCVPLVIGRAQALAQLVNQRLRHQGHGHLAQADVQVERASALPAQILVETKELFDMPAIRKIARQGRHFRPLAGAGESFEMIVLGKFSRALNIAVARLGEGGADRVEGLDGGGEARPVPRKFFWRDLLIVRLQSLAVAQRHEQVKAGLLADAVQQFGAEVLDIGHDQRAGLKRRGKNLLSHLEELAGGQRDGLGAAGVSEANRLASFGVQQEKGLGLFARGLVGGGTALDHVALGVTDLAMGIQGEQLAREVAAGAPEFAEADLELVGLLDGVGLEQVVHGAIGGKKREAIGQFKALVAEGAMIAQGRPAEGRFVNQMQRQTWGQSARAQVTGPGAQQVPSAQAQMLGDKQPQSEQVAGDFISQELPNLAFEAARVDAGEPGSFSSALNRQRGRRVFGVERVEFFFARRNRLVPARRCAG